MQRLHDPRILITTSTCLLVLLALCSSQDLFIIGDEEVLEFGEFNVTCQISNHIANNVTSDITYVWYDELQPSNVLSTAQSYVMYPRRHDDGRTFMCRASGVYPQTWTASITMVVKYQGYKLLHYIYKFSSPLSRSVTLYCPVDAYPAPIYEWTRPDDPAYTTPSRLTDQHTISYVSEQDYGEYTCVVTNEAGVAHIAVQLLRPGIPDVPMTCFHESANTSDVTILCLSGYMGGVARHELSYVVWLDGPLLIPEQLDDKRVKLRTMSTASQLSADTRQEALSIYDDIHRWGVITVSYLRPDMTYNIRIYAANAYGTSEESVSVAFTTGSFPYVSPPSASSSTPVYESIVFIVCVSVAALLLVLVCVVVCVCIARKRSHKPKSDMRDLASTSHSSFERGSQNIGEVNPCYNYSVDNVNRTANDNAGLDVSSTHKHAARRPRPRMPEGRQELPVVAKEARPVTQVMPLKDCKPNVDERYQHQNFVNHSYETDVDKELSRVDRPALLSPDAQTRNLAPGEPHTKSPPNSQGTVAMDGSRGARKQPSLAGFGALQELPMMKAVERQSMRKSKRYRERFMKHPKTATAAHQPSLQQQQHHGYAAGHDGYKQQGYYDNRGHDLNNELYSIANKGVDAHRSMPAPPMGRRMPPYGAETPSLSASTDSIVPEPQWEYPRERLYIRERIGEGLFGEVWRARADGIMGKKGHTLVAVKVLKDDHTPDERRAMKQELSLMKMIQPHPNIVTLLGQCTVDGPLYIIMEFIHNGNLRDVLRLQRTVDEKLIINREGIDHPYSSAHKIPPLTFAQLLRFGYHVASGMDYISSKELLHRDLAARNVLIDLQLTAKICDFGFARDISDAHQYESQTQKRLPIRWMAPESLFDFIYTTKTDVWAFGVLMWEIVTLGSSPYPGVSGGDVMELIKVGYRMEKPKLCSDQLYELMCCCWRHHPHKRPSFSDLVESLQQLKVEATNSQSHAADLSVKQLLDNVYEIHTELPGEKC